MIMRIITTWGTQDGQNIPNAIIDHGVGFTDVTYQNEVDIPSSLVVNSVTLDIFPTTQAQVDSIEADNDIYILWSEGVL